MHFAIDVSDIDSSASYFEEFVLLYENLLKYLRQLIRQIDEDLESDNYDNLQETEEIQAIISNYFDVCKKIDIICSKIRNENSLDELKAQIKL